MLTSSIGQVYDVGMLKQDHMKAIRIEDRSLKALGRIAKRLDRSVSWVIRDAIKQYIERDQQTSAK
jgi:predicted transcriptional regulator